MKSTRGALVVLFLVLGLAAAGYANPPDQPYMRAARTDLQQARAQLQKALHNKGGHRLKAIEHINAAISQVTLGMRFDRRYHHEQRSQTETIRLGTSPDQPHMEKALDHLKQAKSNLERATSDKGGHRVKAIGYVNQAIDEVKKGIDAGA
jgi:multidrug resistance efflux pump